jgi:hypothetical protein
MDQVSSSQGISSYKLDLVCAFVCVCVCVQEVMWDKGGTVRAGDYIFCLWKGKRKSSISNRFLCTPQNSMSS